MEFQYAVGYLSGSLPRQVSMNTAIAMMLGLLVVIVWGRVILKLIQRRREKKVVTSMLAVSGNEINKPDTPYCEPHNPLPGGFPAVYWWENIRDWFMRVWYYNTITVIRLKSEGKADHRAYIVKPIQMSTINWDNCTYNVRTRCLLPVRRNFIMVVIEGISEPLDLWNWADIMNLIQDTYRRKLDETKLDEQLKLKIGKFTFDAREFYTKMNNRDMELMDMTSLPNLQILYYASIIACLGVVFIVAQNMGWLPSAMADRMTDLRAGIVEALKAVKELKPS